MNDLILDLPSGESLTVSRDKARDLVGQLWEIVPEPGAAPLAVAINSGLLSSAGANRPIEVNAREYRALRHVLGAGPEG